MRKNIAILLVSIMLMTSAICVFQIKQVNATGKTSGEWWNNDWIYRKLITINSSQVESTLSNFPVLINLASDSDLVAHAQSDGDDIAFVLDSDNTQLNHEIETFNATTGELICWVNITSLSDTVDTMIWMYYGNPSCSNQQNSTGTWDSNYVGVWHMNQPPSNGETFYDSTSWNNDGTMTDSNENSIQVSGMAGYAVDFFGDADFLTVIDNIELQVTCYFTLEIWLNKDSWSTRARPFSYWHTSLNIGWLTQYDTDRTPKLYVGNGSVDTFDPTHTMPTAGNWGYSAFSFNNKEITGFVNKDCQTDTLSYCSTTHDNNLFIARSYTSTDYFAGSIDEVRYSNVARDQSWINATYDAIANPSSFMFIGNEEMQSEIIVSDPYPADGAIDVELTPTMSINVYHTSSNQMNITWKWNNTGSWDIFGTNYNVFNGTYNQINMNFSSYLTTYEWRVEVDDGIGNWVNETYGFTTRPDNYLPVLSNPLPSNGATGVVAGNVVLSISVSDRDSDLMNITFMTNASGSWQIIGTNVSVPNGSYQQNYDFLDFNITYWWSVNAFDGFGWTNETYSFTTIKEDNEPPTVNITTPQLGFIYIYLFGTQYRLRILPATSTLIIGKIDIKVNAIDNIGINWVKFYINDVLRATISEPPYIWSWNELTFFDIYKIKVVASDLSGNQKSAEIEVYKIQLFEVGLKKA